MSVLTNAQVFASFFQNKYKSHAKLLYRDDGNAIASKMADVIEHFMEPRGVDVATSMEQYLCVLKDTFSEHVITMLADNLQYFYAIADQDHKLANAFVRQLKVEDWIEELIDGLLRAIKDPKVNRFFHFASTSRLSLVPFEYPKKKLRSSIDVSKMFQMPTPGPECSEEIEENAPSLKDEVQILSREVQSPGGFMVKDMASEKEKDGDKDHAFPPSPPHSAGRRTPSDESLPHTSSISNASSPSPPGGARHNDVDIVQICLRGPDLKSAWLSNEVTSSLVLPHWQFDPSMASGYSVYRGFCPQGREELATTIVNDGHSLRHGKKNEISSDNAVHTSFFALRAFLWTVFQATMTTFSLSSNQATLLQQSFTISQKEYHGVLLFVHAFSTPNHGALKSLVLNQTQIESWSPLAENAYMVGTDFKKFFNRRDVRRIHGLAAEMMPDIIHAPERILTQGALHHYIGRGCLKKPIWRSGFISAASVSQLNANRTAIYAITFNQSPSVSEQAKTRKQKSFKTFVRRIWQRYVRRN